MNVETMGVFGPRKLAEDHCEGAETLQPTKMSDNNHGQRWLCVLVVYHVLYTYLYFYISYLQ